MSAHRTSSPSLRLENVSVSYQRKVALRSICLEVEAGSIFFVLGRNGAGKTTLFQAIAGLIGYSGSIAIDGVDIRRYRRRELAKKIVYAPQSVFCPDRISARDFISMSRYSHRRSFFDAPTSSDDDAIASAIELTGADRFLDREFNLLSEGERSKAILAASIAQGAPVLLLDEPMARLDPESAENIGAALVDLNRSGRRLIGIITHDLNQAALNGSRAIGLKDGELFYDIDSGSERLSARDLSRLSFQGSAREAELARHPRSGWEFIAPQIWEREAEI